MDDEFRAQLAKLEEEIDEMIKAELLPSAKDTSLNDPDVAEYPDVGDFTYDGLIANQKTKF